MHAKGELGLDEDFRHEGILGTIFTGRLLRETTVGDYKAVVPALSGTAWITGFAQYVVDPEDPFPNGYTVGDIIFDRSRQILYFGFSYSFPRGPLRIMSSWRMSL